MKRAAFAVLGAIGASFSLAASAQNADPQPFVERRLVLPAWTVQPRVAWELLAFRVLDATRNSIEAGLDLGLPAGIQLGASVVFVEAPDLRFDRIAARGLLEIHRTAAVRVDFVRYRFLERPGDEVGYVPGIGLALEIPLIPGTLALTSGRLFALPPLSRTLELAFSDDLFTVDVNHSNITATAGVPVGLMLQAADPVALAVWTGYRHGWGGGLFSEDWIPVGIDVLLSLFPACDLIASVELPGNVRAYTELYFVRAVLQARF